MPLHSRPAPLPPDHRRATLLAAAAMTFSAVAHAADTSPQLVASFTRQVQPLILNKCAAGACHGGPAAHAPRFHRGDVSGRLDRGTTLANIESLTAAIGPHGNATALLATVSRRHPAGASSTPHQLAPLTAQERAILERWIIAAGGTADDVDVERARHPGTAAAAIVTSASSATKTTSGTSPNRFRAMLEAAANPLPLPPPQEPKGILLGKDRAE